MKVQLSEKELLFLFHKVNAERNYSINEPTINPKHKAFLTRLVKKLDVA